MKKKRIPRVVRDAVMAATASVPKLAKEAGLAEMTIRLWMTKGKTPTKNPRPESLEALASVLRKRAERIARAAGSQKTVRLCGLNICFREYNTRESFWVLKCSTPRCL